MGLFDQIGSALGGLGGESLQRFAGGQADFSNPDSQDHQQFQKLLSQSDQTQLQHVFTQSAKQIDPQDYAEHITPGAGGTNPLGSLGSSGLTTIASLLMKYLSGFTGGNASSLLSRIPALRTTDPQQMDEHQVASLAQYTQQNHPDIFGRVAAQLAHQNPELLHGFLGKSAVASAASMLASQFLKNR